MDPLTWTMIALMLAGTGAQYQATRKVEKENTKALTEERERREKRQRENEATVEQTKQLFDNQKEKEAAAIAAREQATRQQIEAPTQNAEGMTLLDPQSTPTTLNVGTITDQVGKANQYLATRAKLKSALGGYGDVMAANAIDATRLGQDIDARNQSIQRWQEYVLPARMNYAAGTGREWSTAGDVMKLAAMVMAPYALGTGGPGAAADTAAAVSAGGGGGATATGLGAGLGSGAGAAAQNAAATAAANPAGWNAMGWGNLYDPYWWMKGAQRLGPVVR